MFQSSCGSSSGEVCAASFSKKRFEQDAPDDGLRVGDDQRKSWTAIAFIRAGGMLSAPSLMVGAVLGMGLALPGAALATLLGYGFVVAYRATALLGFDGPVCLVRRVREIS